MNGVMYLSMPFLFAIFTNRLARWRRTSAICGLLLSSAGLFLSSFSTSVWQLIITQGVLSALGSSLVYSPKTLYLDEWFLRRKGFAYGTILSSKNLVGVGTPFVVSALLSKFGFRTTLRIWAGTVVLIGIPGIYLMRPRRSHIPSRDRHGRRIPWKFLCHPTFYVFQVSNIIFSSGYGLPQTYLSTYANKVVHLSTTSSSLMLTLFNAPGIVAGVGFGLLCDGLSFGGGYSMSVFAVTCMSALGSALPVFFLWGLSSNNGIAMLSLFSILYGFFAGGYSATWGGVIKEIEREAIDRDEAIDTGIVYGLMNGGRGVGYMVGGFAGVELLKAGAVQESGKWGHGTEYGSMILFTGLCAAFGGWSILWKVTRALLRY
jgi:MFS family permease